LVVGLFFLLQLHLVLGVAHVSRCAWYVVYL
jgi:hypothetical protein